MSQLSIEARPKKWSEVAGQSVPKALLKKIAESPENSPKVIQLYGPFGAAKTTLARIFAVEVNHMKYEDLKTSPFLQELDSSQLNIDTVRGLIESWYAVPTGGYRVIVVDENHLLKAQVQSALLKVLEDMPPRTFILFATTDYDKVLDTIKSRSLEIKLELVPHDEAYKNIYSVCEKFNIPMDDEVAERIIQIGKGHMRTVHQNISKYEMLGKEQFLSLFQSAYGEITNFFIHLGQRNKELCFKDIDSIMQFPLTSIQDDLNKVMLEGMRALVNEGNDLTKLFGANFLKLFKLTQSDWFKSCFSSDTEFQTGLLCIMQIMMEGQAQPVVRPAVSGARR